MIKVPADFASGIANLAGEAGRAWLGQLPLLVDSLCGRWNLVVDGVPMHGYLGLVVPVRRGVELCALKVSWIDDSNVQEIAALAAWNGQGAVRLLASDPDLGAMLLERLDSRRSLLGIEIGEALTIAGQLSRRLSVPAPAGFRLLEAWARRLVDTMPERWDRLGRSLPRSLVDTASDLASRLGPSAGTLLVNYDLHYENVLAGQREPWLTIDPKPIVGDPEFGVAQLFWTRLEDVERAGGLGQHFRQLVDEAGLDAQLARAWTLVRCVDYWLWALSIGLTGDPVRCAIITSWLDR